MTLPLWISQDQVDRLKTQIEAEGFTSVKIAKGPRGGEIVVTGYDGERDFNVSVMRPLELDSVVGRFLKWRDQRNG